MRSIALCLAAATLLSAQTNFEYWPGTQYDPAIPTHQKVLGYAAGDRISWHASIVRYMEALAAAAPDRIKLYDYAKTWEGRRLVYAAIGSPANIRRLDQIKAGMRRLADPRTTPAAEASQLAGSLPAVVWLGYGVHGNEISSPDAALYTAYHLLAARRDPVVDKILANVVVLIDPIQNPDGRDRFVHHFEISEGLEPVAHQFALEHVEPWLSGRTNHYHFDMNRDWFALTQPETRGRVKTLLEWHPQVFVDLHEMGSDSTYYFAPEAIPYNPHLTADQRTSLDWFGKNNARWFDKYGFNYFTREVYDAFYPGYGASWPAYFGAIAMTYEQSSARGLVVRRTDGTRFQFRDTVRQHFVASISTAEAAADNKANLLANFRKYRESAIAEGGSESVREYILPRRGDIGATDKLARTLAELGIEVDRAAAPFRNAGNDYPAGSYVIRLNQPSKRMIRTLLDPQIDMDAEFLKEQERLRKKKLPDEIYDVTGWAMPLLYNVEWAASAEVSSGNFTRITFAPVPGSVTGGRAEVAYLVPWGSQSASRFLTAALREGLQVLSSAKGFQQNGRQFPRGTLIVRVSENPATVHDAVARLAASTGAEVAATGTGWVESGINFGSRFVSRMKKPEIAIAWDSGVSTGSAGHTRFVLERQYGYPTIPIRTSTLGNAKLSELDVIILPDGNYASALGGAVNRLKDWVAAGGTLIAIEGAVNWLADPKVDLLSIRREELPHTPAKKEEKESTIPGKYLESAADLEKAIAPEKPSPDLVAGVLARAQTDNDHWVTAGVPETVNAVVSGRSVFTPVRLDRGVNAAFFAEPSRLLASGYLWEENRKLLAFKPLVAVERSGRGHIIAFTADPNFRAYLDGMNLLFLNAVFGGPAHAR